ncbi:hypothetical protein [Streptacidiphilus anmyonensis]|uniref:hypothetical protein n=1 Tax=Streptacidiphilus anmyonensis TaxID=405782 RepID=UPI0005A66FF4|nr:hypothetical protein [Streptacidiphilus anmyonensis]
MSNQSRLATPAELEAAFQQELATDRWAATETAYALATLLRDAGEWDQSRTWVTQCLDLLGTQPTDELEQVVPRRQSVGGVPLPNYLHEGVVRERFGELA